VDGFSGLCNILNILEQDKVLSKSASKVQAVLAILNVRNGRMRESGYGKACKRLAA
jgi:hypothetical protein